MGRRRRRHRLGLASATSSSKRKEYIYKVSEAKKAAQKRYYNKIKENPEFQEVRCGYSKNHYDNNKSIVIARVQRYQAKQQDLEQLERLHERQQQELIHVHKG